MTFSIFQQKDLSSECVDKERSVRKQKSQRRSAASKSVSMMCVSKLACVWSHLANEYQFIREETYIVHVLAQQILKGLSNSVALSHDAFAAVVTCARGVGH